jgi:hypothetical protein
MLTPDQAVLPESRCAVDAADAAGVRLLENNEEAIQMLWFIGAVVVGVLFLVFHFVVQILHRSAMLNFLDEHDPAREHNRRPH